MSDLSASEVKGGKMKSNEVWTEGIIGRCCLEEVYISVTGPENLENR